MLSKRLANLSIHSKLVWVLLIALSLTMLMATLLLIAYDYKNSKESLEAELDILTKVIADRSRAAVSFKDKRAALGNLESLKVKRSVEQACLFFMDDKLFVSYTNSAFNSKACKRNNFVDNSPYIYTDKSLFVRQYVYLNKKPIGLLQVQVSLDPIYERMFQFSFIAFFILILSSLLAYILTLRLQGLITRPLQLLSKAASSVTSLQDYSIRAEKQSDDEIGELVDTFNSMLNTIHSNQLQLREAMIVLDEKKKVSDAKALTAEDKHAALKEFFAGVSHDLKQPINAMGLFMEAMKRAPNAHTQLELMDKLEQSLINLNQMFTDLLDKSKFEQGFLKISKKTVNLSSMFSIINHEFGALASDKNIRLLMHGYSKEVVSDPLMLERIIRNLVSNAVRYTDTGGVLVGARNRNNEIWIDVWDSGKGIPEEKISEIFKARVQLDNPDQDPGKGFGLGLSIVKKMVDNLGHELEIKSIPEKGTLMRLKIKVESKQVVNKIKPQTQALTSVINDPLSGLKALIVDDDSNVLDATDTIVKSWGIQTYCASTYQLALDMAAEQQYKFDLILADYDLGQGKNGADLIKELHQLADKDIPALIISGESSEFLSELSGQGFNILKKPVKAARLRAMINHSLSKN